MKRWALARVLRTTTKAAPVSPAYGSQSGGLAIASARMRLGDRGVMRAARRMRVAATSGPRGHRCARPSPSRRPRTGRGILRGRFMLNTTTTATTDSPSTPAHSPAHSPWTPERIEQLRNCVTSGLSCSQIAAEIGVTRNAVIGKIHRLGLSPGRPAAAPARSCPPRVRQPRHSPQRRFLRLMFAPAPSLAGDEAAAPAAIELDAALLARRAGARQVSLADRRSLHRGFRLLRQRGDRGLLLLRRPCPHGLSGASTAARLASDP